MVLTSGGFRSPWTSRTLMALQYFLLLTTCVWEIQPAKPGERSKVEVVGWEQPKGYMIWYILHIFFLFQYLLYVYYMYIICILYVYYMFCCLYYRYIMCILHIVCMFVSVAYWVWKCLCIGRVSFIYVCVVLIHVFIWLCNSLLVYLSVSFPLYVFNVFISFCWFVDLSLFYLSIRFLEWRCFSFIHVPTVYVCWCKGVSY